MSKAKVNTGSAWAVIDKKSEKHPGYSGTVNVDGVLHFCDVWVKEWEGKKFLSMSFKKRDKQDGETTLRVNTFDDEI